MGEQFESGLLEACKDVEWEESESLGENELAWICLISTVISIVCEHFY